MDNLITTALVLLNTLGQALSNPNSPLSPHAQYLINSIGAFLQAGEETLPEFQQFSDHVHALVIENVDPTDTDFAQLKARSNAAHALLQSGDT